MLRLLFSKAGKPYVGPRNLFSFNDPQGMCPECHGIGRKIGEHGLTRFVPARRLERVKRRVQKSGAIALALPGLIPPPFPYTPFILTSGALDVDPVRFLGALAVVRLMIGGGFV